MINVRRRGKLNFRLAVHSDATASVAYPYYRLTSAASAPSLLSTPLYNESGATVEGGAAATAAASSSSAAGRRLGSKPRKASKKRKGSKAKRSKKSNAGGAASAEEEEEEEAEEAAVQEGRGGHSQHVGGSDGGNGGVNAGWVQCEKWGTCRRLPLVRSGLSRLTLRLTARGIELYCEGLYLESQPWPDSTSATSTPPTPDTARATAPVPAFGVSVRMAKPPQVRLSGGVGGSGGGASFFRPPKIFYAWRACAERSSSAAAAAATTNLAEAQMTAGSGGRRTLTHSCAADVISASALRAANASIGSSGRGDACAAIIDTPHLLPPTPTPATSAVAHPVASVLLDRTLEWRAALRLAVVSQPLLLPERDERLSQTRFIRTPRARCVNEVKLEQSTSAPNAAGAYLSGSGAMGAMGEADVSSSSTRGRYRILGPSAAPKPLESSGSASSSPPPPPPPSAAASTSALAALAVNESALLACSTHCTEHDACVGYRVNTLNGQCVFLKALKSTRAEVCFR